MLTHLHPCQHGQEHRAGALQQQDQKLFFFRVNFQKWS